MNKKSISTLVWSSAILLVIGVVSLNPALSFGLSALSVVAAAIAAVLSRNQLRILSIVIMVVAIANAVVAFPEAKKHLENYRKHTASQARLVTGSSAFDPLARTSNPLRVLPAAQSEG